MKLSRISRRLILSYLRHFYSLFKDLHFGWFVLIPLMLSSGSVAAGLARQTGYLTAGLALIAVLSLTAIQAGADRLRAAGDVVVPAVK